MSNGWNQLHCAFFSAVCLETLGGYFRSVGFLKHHADEVGGIAFEGDRCYVEVSYEPDTFPRYSPTLLVGLAENVAERIVKPAVPFWFLVPSGESASNYSFWKFESPDELRDTLEQLLYEVIHPYGEPLFTDEAKLKAWILRFSKERL